MEVAYDYGDLRVTSNRRIGIRAFEDELLDKYGEITCRVQIRKSYGYDHDHRVAEYTTTLEGVPCLVACWARGMGWEFFGYSGQQEKICMVDCGEEGAPIE
tara:strand:- start:11514 stop:11816 length:303 start_codon:yes stop_codon:yes gene_type:complete